MTPVKNILVPLDFSNASKQALRYACQLADVFDASLHLLHVAENPYPPLAYTEVCLLPPELLDRLEREALTLLNESLTAEEKAKYVTVLIYRFGVPAREILSYLDEQREIDLVVMATHGRGGMTRLMLGSVAERVVRAAPCPVLTLRASEGSSQRAGRAA